jgi:hypothetical protein
MTGRQDGEMSRKMRELRCQFLPDTLDKLPNRTSYVSDQRVTRVLHVNPKLYRVRGAAGVPRRILLAW